MNWIKCESKKALLLKGQGRGERGVQLQKVLKVDQRYVFKKLAH